MASDFGELRKLGRDIAKAPAKVQRSAERVVAKTAADIEADGKRFAPVDTGALVNSISSDVDGLSAEIGPTVDYAPYVEDGTSRMAPQPFMGRAADRRIPKFEQAMEKIAEKVLSGSARDAETGRFV